MSIEEQYQYERETAHIRDVVCSLEICFKCQHVSETRVVRYAGRGERLCAGCEEWAKSVFRNSYRSGEIFPGLRGRA